MIWILPGAALLVLAAAFGCYLYSFYAPPRKPLPPEVIEIPEGEIYEPFREAIENWTREVRAMEHKDFTVTSFDGLTLHGKFYEYKPGAPIELMFHGYRGTAERDLSGGVQRCFRAGRSILLVDQRCSGRSQGRTITFGIREHQDCLTWVEFMVNHFGPDVKIILTGVSMGAATVLMAGGRELPPNVMGILADCSYSSPKEIMSVVMAGMGLPAKLCYPFVKLGARLFGGFDLDAYSPIQAVKRCKVPVIFFHGEDDAFVPCQMSRDLYDACASRKRLVTIPGAGHGLSYPMEQEYYLQVLGEFFGPEASA